MSIFDHEKPLKNEYFWPKSEKYPLIKNAKMGQKIKVP